MKIVLFQPEIPQNTGNIVRTCAVTGAGLVLVRPLGFSTSSKMLKRSGLDYWKDVSIREIEDLPAFLREENKPFYFFSSKVRTPYSRIKYTKDALLIFGSETKGLPACFRQNYPDRFLNIPMKKNSRCLNLSNAAAIVLYEAYRQQNFCF